MAKSKSINIFLIDGNSTGRIKCTMQNWTGIAYKIPRFKLEDSKTSPSSSSIAKHLEQTGIYFLLGQDENGNQIIYVGQAGVRKNGRGLLGRLLEHKNNVKESYANDRNEVICFTTQNDAFGPTEISYLENRFTNIANESGRYVVKNSNEPNSGNITEEKESEMEEFIDYAKIMVGVLGHKVFEPIIKKDTERIIEIEEKESPIFNYIGRFKAFGKLTNEGFVILKGSEINQILCNSAPKSTIKYRKIYSFKIKDNILLDDLLFTSPSAAASFIAGRSASGNVEWKTIDKKSPNEI